MNHGTRIRQHPTYESFPGYWRRHELAIDHPTGPERPFIGMLRGWLEYADTHRTRFESGIGEDYVLGPEWERIGRGLRAMLNGDLGRRLDCGALDSIILDALKDEGFGDD